MATRKQVQANRQNGKKGGPKTPAGRAAVRFNAQKHGLLSQHPVLIDGEEDPEYVFYRKAFITEFQPVGVMEHLLVDQLAVAHWRRQRIIVLERGVFALGAVDLKEYIEATYSELGDSANKHLIALKDTRDQDSLGRYYRYDARFERSFYKAYKELTALQAARLAQTTEPDCSETKVTKGPSQESLHFAEQTQFPPNSAEPDLEPEAPMPPNRDNDASIM